MTSPGGILVIKLGALGDLIQAFGPFAAIRAHHPAERITALTAAPFAPLLQASPWFDEVLIDPKPSWLNLPALWSLRQRLRAPGFRMVYDLQTSSRSSKYFHLMGGSVPWSGIASGASHPHANPNRDRMHTLDRQRDQLAMAGISSFPAPDTGWLHTAPPPLAPPPRMALLFPGAAPHRPGKRWPHFPALAQALAARGFTPVVAGTRAEAPLAAAIQAACPTAHDITGGTTLLGLAALIAHAELVLGNDTGPMHLAALLGRPSTVLFGAESDPARCAPRGPFVRVLRTLPIQDIKIQEVLGE